jgi:predicted nucleic acid-binding protein
MVHMAATKQEAVATRGQRRRLSSHDHHVQSITYLLQAPSKVFFAHLL